jgi:carboxymethylenebutenolidase
MCFDNDSEPPVAAGDRAISTRDVTLTADDGNVLAAFEAFGEDPSEAAIVVLPDVRGLYRFYKDLAARLAQAGHDAIAIDYFGRTAGLAERTDDWDYQPHVEATTLPGVRSDVAAAVSRMRADDPNRKVFTVGFCFGGSNSWHQAANGLQLTGVVGFYGRPRRDGEDGGVITRVGQMTCPLLALMGGDDPGIPLEAISEFEDALNAAGVSNEVVVYPGAPHSFFDRKYEAFAEESADAWKRVLAFVGANP